MSLLQAVLQLLVVVLFLMGSAGLLLMFAGCLTLRVMARNTARYDGNIVLKSPLVPGISIVLTLPNASEESRTFAKRALELHFGKHELVLVLDGPSEAEMEIWAQEFRLSLSARTSAADLPASAIRGIYESRDPIRLVVVDKQAGGEADALNAGVNAATSPIIGLLDPLSQFDSRILLRLIRPMLEDPERTVGICGFMPTAEETGLAQARHGQADANSWIGRFGELESLRVWLGRCAAFARWNRTVPVPGGAMLVWREAIVKAGGFTGGPLDLFLKLHCQGQQARKPYRIAFVPEGASFARVPCSLADLQKRAAEDTSRLRAALKHGHLGSIGWGMPALVAIKWLRPLLETAALLLAVLGLLTRQVDFALVALVLLATAGLGIVTSMAAVLFRELVKLSGSDPAQLTMLFLSAIPENLGYRQWRNLWLVAGLFGSSAQKQNRG